MDSCNLENVSFQVRKEQKVATGTVTLFDPDSNEDLSRSFQNLRLYDENGQEIWKAELPKSYKGDCYVSFKIVGDKIIGFGFFSWMAEIDPLSGKILKKELTK